MRKEEEIDFEHRREFNFYRCIASAYQELCHGRANEANQFYLEASNRFGEVKRYSLIEAENEEIWEKVLDRLNKKLTVTGE